MTDDRSLTLAPAAAYASSGKNAADPAPRSRKISKPPLVRRPTTSGVRATRRSLGAISFGTPMRIELRTAWELWSGSLAVLRQHPLREVHAFGEVVELLA